MQFEFNQDAINKLLSLNNMYNTLVVESIDTVGDSDTLDPDDIYAQIATYTLDKLLKYIPVNTGNLKSAIKITKYKNGFTIYIDDKIAPYAKYVHEIPFYEHKYPQRYKFLEDAAVETINEYITEIGFIPSVKITYDPLCLYIGVSDAPGTELAYISQKQKYINNQIQSYIHDFENIDSIINSIKQNDSKKLKAYYTRLNNYKTYWHNRMHNNLDLVIHGWMEKEARI